MKSKEVAEVITAFAVVLGGVYTFAKFDERLDQLEKRTDRIEGRIDPVRQLKTAKGDICLEILRQLADPRGGKREQELNDQWDESGCKGLPAAAMIDSMNVKTANRER